MTEGGSGFFGPVDQRKDNNIKAVINDDEVKKLLKRYKKIKKYMKSPLYEVKVMDGKEDVVSKLVDEDNG
jgi:hypothetical protein